MSKNHFPTIITPKQSLKWLEWIAVGLSLWLLLYPHPYEYLFTVVLLMPIIGLLANGVNRPSIISLVSISKTTKGRDYDVADFIDFPAWIVLVRVILDFKFESFFSIIKVGTVGFALLLILLLFTHKTIVDKFQNRSMIYFHVIGNIALYSYAATYGVNCVYDFSEVKVYESKVVDKHISHGKHNSYYLTVKPWGERKEDEDISVSSSKYDQTAIGQNVKIDFKSGLFNIPWYNLE